MGPRLAERAGAWRRRYLARAWADGAARLAAGALLAFAAALWLDQALTLPQRARLVMLGAAVVALGGAAGRLLVLPWLRFDWGALLDEAARALPALRLHLRPAWELARGGSPDTSEALRRAHIEETEALLARAPDDARFSWRPTPRLSAALAAAGLAVVSLAWAPEGAFPRLLAPWRDAALETLLAIEPGDAQAEWGRPATITARWLPGAPAGRARHELALWVREGGGSWRRAAWDKASGDERRYTVDEVTAPLEYRVAWRDLQSRGYVLTPVLAPQLESVRARVHGADAGVVPLTPAEPLTVMRGSLVTVMGRPNQPLSRAVLKLSTLPQPVLLKEAAGGELEASFVAQEDAQLRFELETPDGRTDPAPPAYAIKALPDQPPVVELLSPLETVLASPSDALPIAYSAKDDGGLAWVKLLLRPAGKPQRELALERFSGRRDFVGDYSLDLSALPLGKVEFQLMAADNGSPQQTALSAKGAFVVADLAAAHAQTEKQWKKTEQSLEKAAKAVEQAKADLEAGKQASPQDAYALQREWQRASQDMKDLAQSMQQDAYANPGLAEEAKNASEQLSQSPPDAAQKHDKLAKRLERARKLLEQGRQLQALQDFHSDTGRLAQSGQSLEAKLEQLARGAKPTKEQKAKLDAELAKIQKQVDALQKALQSLPKAESNPDQARKALEMPVESARQNADALQRALERGDFEEAARLARKLSEDLAKIQQAVAQSAASSPSASMPRETQQRTEAAEKLWDEVVQEQTRLVERTQKIEDARTARRLESQRSLLAELAKRQAVAVSSAAATARFPADALANMRAAQEEFERKKVEQAPQLLRSAGGRARGFGFPGIAAMEDQIAQELDKAAAAELGEPAGPESEQAGREQDALRAKTQKLQGEVESLEAETGASAGEAGGQLRAAQGEQEGAAKALSRRDTAGALPRQQKALELLSQGGGQMSQGSQGQQGLQQRMMQPFQRPGQTVRVLRSGGGQQGAQLGFVPLPSAKDYLPPKELREELEKSLQESRPQSQDALIKEYFKRITQ